MPHYEFFCRTCRKPSQECWPWSIGLKERSHVRTAAAMRLSKCGRLCRSLRRRNAREVDLLVFPGEVEMEFGHFSFGSVQIDDATYEHDVIVDRGEILKRKKKPSKRFQDEFGHTPLSVEEDIPWKCKQLVIGTGAYGRLPVMEEVKRDVAASNC